MYFSGNGVFEISIRFLTILIQYNKHDFYFTTELSRVCMVFGSLNLYFLEN